MAPHPDDRVSYFQPPPPPPAAPTPTGWTPPYIEGITWSTWHPHTLTPGERQPKTTVYGVDGDMSWTSVGYGDTATGTFPVAEQTGAAATEDSSSSQAAFTPPPYQPQSHHPPPQVFAAAGAITALLVCGLVLAACFLMYKKKRNQRRQDAVQMAERAGAPGAVGAVGAVGVKNVAAHLAHPADTRSYMGPPTEPPPPAALASSSSSSSVPSTSGADQPVILSRTMDQSYYTGIDTSDHISLAETRSHSSGETYVDGQDEPPPPYRPASVPPISRDNSVRISNGITLDRNLRNSVRQIRSPFDDPEEEVSDLEDEPTPLTNATSNPPPPLGLPPPQRRDTDAVSDVSDLSYQRDETRPHSNL
jgi:hypothetical protein